MPANTRGNSSAMSVSLPVTAKVMREASSEWMIFHRFCSLIPFSLSFSPPRYDMDQLLIPIFFFFFIGSIDCRCNDHIPTDRSDPFYRYRISAHIKTIAYFPLQRWLNLPAFPTNERTNERTNYESRCREFSNPVRVSQIHKGERVYFVPNGWRSASDDRNRASNRSATSLKILVENRINVRVG